MALVHRKPLVPVIQCVGPEDLAEGASTGPYISLADYRSGWFYIMIGDVAGATSAVTLYQATDYSGTGAKALEFDNHCRSGQRLKFTGRSATNFSLGETITGGSSGNTAYVAKISSDELVVVILTGSTTWTDAETITGGTSGATATVSGTGQDEDILVELTTASDTFNTLAITFKTYAIFVDDSMLDVANGFDHVQIRLADASSTETQGCAIFIPDKPRMAVYPAVSTLYTQKTD